MAANKRRAGGPPARTTGAGAARSAPGQAAQRARAGSAGPRSTYLAVRPEVAVCLVAASVLAWVPGGYSRFVLAKVLLMAVAIAAGALGIRRGELPRPVLACLALGAAIFLLAALTGDTPWASLVGRWPRYEGLPVLAIYAASAWLGARLCPDVPLLARALAAMTWVLAAFSLVEVAGASPFGRSSQLDRTGAVLGNATDQGLVAMMAACVLLSAGLVAGAATRARWLLASTAAALVTVAASGSRAAVLLTLLGGGVVLLVHRGRRRDRGYARIALLGLALLAAAALAVPTTRSRLASLETLRGRWDQWRLTLDLVADHPWLGTGPGSYVDVFGRYETADWVRWVGPRTFPDSPHNWLLQLLVAGGIPLLLCGLALGCLVVTRGVQVVRARPELTGCFVAVVAYGVALLVDFTIAGPTCLAAFLAGVVLAVPAGTAEPRWRPTVVAVAAGVTALALALACVSEVQVGDALRTASGSDGLATAKALRKAGALRGWDADYDALAAQALARQTSARISGTARPAEQHARDSLGRLPDDYDGLVSLGIALVAQDRLAEARDALDRAVGLRPERAAAYVQRGIARWGLQDPDGALADLTRARGLDRRDRSIRRLLRSMREQRAERAAG